jgi:ATP-dependent helicase/nuclease subunit A
MSETPHDPRPAAYQCNGEPTSREAFYALACDPERSLVVQACAGAGKTWMLVSRMLRALLDGAQPHEVLAITFTRKAAGEMRQRLNDWLLAFSEQRASIDQRVDELQLRGMSIEQARALAPRLGQLHAQLLQSGRPVQIHTFHRWFFQLLRAAPLELLGELQLSSDMQLVEEWADHEDEVYRRFHAAVLRDPDLHQDFHALVHDHGRSQLRKWLDVAWQKRIELALADQAGRLENSVPPAAQQWPEFEGLSDPAQRVLNQDVQAVLHHVATLLGREKAALARQAADQLVSAFPIQEAWGQFLAVRSALYTKTDTLRRAVDVPAVQLALPHLEAIHAACEQQAAHERHLRMVRLSRCLLNELALYKRANGLADMADLELCAFKLLSNSSLSGWVHERLDARIRHLLIDEFQDTSPLQWHALQAWLSGYAGAGGGASGQRPPSVFIVGDPKQSIYRFRRAEPKVFEAAQVFVQEALDGSLLACDHTHRNAPGVLQVVNAVFETACAQGEYSGYQTHTTQRTGHHPTHPGLCYLPVLEVPKALEDNGGGSPEATASIWRDSLTTPRLEPEQARRAAEAAKVADAIAQLVHQQSVPPQDIKVLSRTRAALLVLQNALQARGLPFAAAGQYALADEMVVRDLLALLDVLVSPQNDLSLAHALRSPVFGASDADLITLFEAVRHLPADHGSNPSWWQALMVLSSPSPALARASGLLAQWQRAAQQLPPHDLLDRIVAQGQVRERVAASWPSSLVHQALAAIDALLAQALMLDGARYATPYRFVRALRRRAIHTTAAAPTQATALLTVHGAKGLESPWVFLMDTDPGPQAAETVTLLVDWPVQAAAPLACGFVYSTKRCPPSLSPLLEVENEARQREELNGLYVALTRAQSHIVISATPSSKRSASMPSWWSRLLPHAQVWPLQPAAQGVHQTQVVATTLWQLPVLRPSLLEKPPPAVRAEPSEAPVVSSVHESDAPSEATSSHLGQAIHLALQWASQTLDEQRRVSSTPTHAMPDLIAWCQAAAQMHGVPPQEVMSVVQGIWHSPACQVFFNSPQLRWSGNEVPVWVDGVSQRMDRLVALEESGRTTWWVLDYKLHPAPHTVMAYCMQLRTYAKAVALLQAPDAVRCAFITGEGGLVELPLPG